MDSWWQLGEWSGFDGGDLGTWRIICPFCSEKGNFARDHLAQKAKPNARKILNFETLKCGNCAGYVMVLWSSTEGFSQKMHDFRVIPWPLKLDSFPEHWNKDVGRYWLQAKRNLRDENWDAAVLMARSALQVALRDQNAQSNSLKKEIEDLANRGILPPIMKEWSDKLRLLGNDSAHPVPGQDAPDKRDATDIIGFLDFLLEYLYTLPHRIAQYTKREAQE